MNERLQGEASGSVKRAPHEFPIHIDAIARGEVPDRTIRVLLRFGIASVLRSHHQANAQCERKRSFVEQLKQSPIAVETDAANAQHYEVAPEFFRMVLGKRCKYSCGYWSAGVHDLDASEDAMLKLLCERADIKDGQTVLDLGCGWGAASLAIAEWYPNSRVHALSNSCSQRRHIVELAQRQGLQNITVETTNVVDWDTSERFDRVISVELFEHLRNYELMLERIARWLEPRGRLFVHLFTHRRYAYVFEDNWMADTFFTVGMMPSDDLLLHFQKDLRVVGHWHIDGTHYQRTSEAWLDRLDQHRDRILTLFAQDRTRQEAERALALWRLFFLSCAESFGYAQGQEWQVSHYTMERT